MEVTAANNIGTAAKLFCDAKRTQKRLNAELKVVDCVLSCLRDEMLTHMANSGLNSVRTEDGATVYLQRQVWAGAVDGDTAGLAHALESAGLKEFTTVNHQSFSAFMRDQLEHATEKRNGFADTPTDGVNEVELDLAEELPEDLPKELRERIRLTEKFTVKATGIKEDV